MAETPLLRHEGKYARLSCLVGYRLLSLLNTHSNELTYLLEYRRTGTNNLTSNQIFIKKKLNLTNFMANCCVFCCKEMLMVYNKQCVLVASTT